MKSRDKILFGGLAILLLAVGWLVFEHYHLKNKVEQFKRERMAKGDRFIMTELAPVAPPYEINGASAFTDIKSRIGSLSTSNTVSAMTFVAHGKARIAWQQAEPGAPDSMNLWENLAAELKDNRPLLSDLCEVLKTNQVLDFRPNYAAGFKMSFVHVVPIKVSVQIFSAATLLELHDRNYQTAFNHLLAGSLLIKRYNNEPVLIAQLVRMAGFEIALATTWEALQGDQWSEAQWRELQQVWETTSVLPIWMDTFRMESAFACEYFADLRIDPAMLGYGTTQPTNLTEVFEKLWTDPEGGWKHVKYLTKWRYWTSYQEELRAIKKGAVTVDSLRVAINQDSLQPLKSALEEFGKQFPSKSTDSFSGYFDDEDSELKFILKMGGFETRRRMLMTAIALKRYHIKHKKYPNSLAEMISEFLSSQPVDFMDGKPLRYRLNPDGNFRLYSVGDDGLDQGGSTEPAEASSTSFQWHRAKDWVWPQPATAAEVRQYVESKQKRKKK